MDLIESQLKLTRQGLESKKCRFRKRRVGNANMRVERAFDPGFTFSLTLYLRSAVEQCEMECVKDGAGNIEYCRFS